MKTNLHLVSMPMAYPLHPSCQLGYLHAYFKNSFSPKIAVSSHSAYLEILLDAFGSEMYVLYLKYRMHAEEIFYLVCYLDSPHSEKSFDEVLDLYNSYYGADLSISRTQIESIRESIETYLTNTFIPTLSNDVLNVVGFTTTFSQLFASIYAARFIKRHSDKNVLFVFGGASMSIPEASQTLKLWDIDGLMIVGAGEGPLSKVLDACLSMPESESNPIDFIDSLNLPSVSRTGTNRKPINLGVAKDILEKIPTPNYDEYFRTLRNVCDNEETYLETVKEHVAIPLEGSRGCFARCDFCQIPGFTPDFRTLKGKVVAEQALAISKLYKKDSIVFADAVCNAWAEDYSDFLLQEGKTLSAFMEMRVHRPERFWTKLSLAGVDKMQLGIETLSESLLLKMRKGTTVMQNISAFKYLVELQIGSDSNLIVNHPKSNAEDVKETKRIISALEHFPKFYLSHFDISYASAIHNELTEQQKSELVGGFYWLPLEMKPYSFLKHLAYLYPSQWRNPETADAWEEFEAWYESHLEKISITKPTFTVTKSPSGDLVFFDSRFAKNESFTLTGPEAQIYNFCHEPMTTSQLESNTGMVTADIISILEQFVDRKIMLKVGDRYLSLAIRPRNELIEKFQQEQKAKLDLKRELINSSIGI